MFGGGTGDLVNGFDGSVELLLLGVGRRGALFSAELVSEGDRHHGDERNSCKESDRKDVLLFTVPGSIFGFTVTSCDEDFLGIRNVGMVAFGAARGFVIVPGDGLVNLAARRGGEVTDVLFTLPPDEVGRLRFCEGSLPAMALAFCEDPAANEDGGVAVAADPTVGAPVDETEVDKGGS